MCLRMCLHTPKFVNYHIKVGVGIQYSKTLTRKLVFSFRLRIVVFNYSLLGMGDP